MQYKVIATHNPQDFFEGAEPDELTIIAMVDEQDLTEYIKGMKHSGYTLILIEVQDG